MNLILPSNHFHKRKIEIFSKLTIFIMTSRNVPPSMYSVDKREIRDHQSIAFDFFLNVIMVL